MSRIRTYVVGRGRGCDVRLDDPSVSRRHAELVRVAGGRLYVTDCATANGTFVLAGEAWREVRQAFVDPRGRIRFGDCRMSAARLDALCVPRTMGARPVGRTRRWTRPGAWCSIRRPGRSSRRSRRTGGRASDEGCGRGAGGGDAAGGVRDRAGAGRGRVRHHLPGAGPVAGNEAGGEGVPGGAAGRRDDLADRADGVRAARGLRMGPGAVSGGSAHPGAFPSTTTSCRCTRCSRRGARPTW